MRRQATLATVSHWPAGGIDGPEGTERLLKGAETYLRRAARLGADIVAFPEVYPQLAAPEPFTRPEPVDGGTLGRVRELARELGIYIIWPRLEDGPDGKRNASVLVGRDGEVVGRYHKMFPTVSELDAGVVPGEDCPVFTTDFGRLAMAICFDLNFPEVRERLRDRLPDALFFSSMYRGGLQLQEWALDLGCHVASAISAELGRLVDPGGQVLRVSTYEALLAGRVNLNRRQLHMDGNWQKMDEMLARYGSRLTFDFYTPEARFVIGYEGDDRDVDEICREFGLELLPDYFARSRCARERALAKF